MDNALNDTLNTPDIAARTLVQARTLNAPRALVWQVWTDPKHLVQWWGPNGFTISSHEHNPAEGGLWRFRMHGPDGTEWPNRIEYTRLVEPERMEWLHGSDEEPDMFQVTVTMDDLGNGKTGLTMRHLFKTVEGCEQAKAYGAIELGAQTIDKLEAELARMQNMPRVDELFSLTRQVNAPRQLVWSAFTRAEHLANWWGPKGPGLEVVQLNLRPGGIFHYAMVPPAGDDTYGTGGGKAYGRFLYREVDEPNRMVLISSFADADGNAIPAPFPGFPKEILNTWTFTEEGGKTTIHLKGGPLNATPEERAFFSQMKGSMEQGFGGTFEKLDEYLASLR